MQEMNLNYEMTVIRLCATLRNIYEIMSLRKLCDYVKYAIMKYEINILLKNKISSKKFQKTSFTRIFDLSGYNRIKLSFMVLK